MAKAYKVAELSGKKMPKKEGEELPSSLRGKLVVIKPKESEIAKNLEITEQGEFKIKSI